MSQNILVTGTNCGFGRLITRSLAESGHQAFATMRDVGSRNAQSAAELIEFGEGRIHVEEMVLTDDASVARAVAAVLDQAGHVDVVVNNAGYGSRGLEETFTSAQLLAQYDVNVVGPHRVMRACLPSMRARGQGLVIQISSSLGRLVVPMMGAYCSSKFALEALSDAYRYELAPTGVEVTVVQPGRFLTDSEARVITGAEQERAAGYGPLANGLDMVTEKIAKLLPRSDALDPQQVADAVLALVESPAGHRPARVVVDPLRQQMMEGLNKSLADAQRTQLDALGMPVDLAT